ncbi:protein translocase subunit SecY [Alphaproteobacteria bacterium]|nr:protein translocase subunit SecY [Alphaproteobacteria bacterium]GHS95628.1 protein translocase subunit SecY [Alphaproteobacteria bacterium]
MSSDIEQFASGASFGVFSKAKDLHKRIWFTLAALVVCRLGTYVPLPGVNPRVISEFLAQNSGGLLGFLDMFSGGAVSRMTMFTLGIVPYISSSIIVQLMTSVFPSFEALKKEGEAGRKKLGLYTRYGAIMMASVQAFGVAAGLEHMTGASGPAVIIPGFFFRLMTVLTLTGSTMFLVWVGDQITSRGIGNGTSLIIYAGIVANLPMAISKTFALGRQQVLSLPVLFLILLGIVGLIYYVVYMERAQRRLPVQYPKRQMSVGMPASAQNTHLPMKLNSAGVIPPIFASSLLTFPAMILTFVNVSEDSWMRIFTKLFARDQILYVACFVGLIIFFAYFYTALMFNPEETADNLRKSGSYIPGIRPGQQTTDYLDYILTRLTAVGSVYLASVCVIPEFIVTKMVLPFYIGGTSILIVVSVTIDTIGQIQSHLMAHQYEGLIRKAKAKGKI